MRFTILPISLLALIATGCGDDDAASGEGRASFSVWGEEYIEQEIPSSEFEDGWTVSYDKFLIVVGGVTVEDAELGDGGGIDVSQLFNLQSAGPHAVGAVDGLAAGNWRSVGYRNPAMGDDTTLHESASQADADLMRDGGYNIYASGTASKGTDTYTFSWGFQDNTTYSSCVDVGGGQETDGIVVPDGSGVDVQLTIHGDHLFYDDLASGDALLRFDHMAAADADMDGDVTLEELDAIDLSTLPADAGPYGVGAGNVNTLGDFVRAATHTLGHFNGEGHCSVFQ